MEMVLNQKNACKPEFDKLIFIKMIKINIFNIFKPQKLNQITILICRNAFSRSPTTPILFTLKRRRTPNNVGARDELVYKKSLMEDKPSKFALASNTGLNFVVVLSGHVTSLCGKYCFA